MVFEKMPANLPPQYFEIEKKLKTASEHSEKISILEELLSIVPKHKGTEKIQAQLKSKISKLKTDTKRKPSTAKHGPEHNVKKSGAGQIILIGPPNSGKSSLIKALTNASPQVSDYPFTTISAYPAMMRFENIQIQLVDTPPITTDYLEAWIPELIKPSDGVVLVLDLHSPEPVKDFQFIIHKLTERRIDFVGPDPADSDITGRFQKKLLVVVNKSDVDSAMDQMTLLAEHLHESIRLIPVSAHNGSGLDKLKNHIFIMLNIIRVYSKNPGSKIEYDSPFTLKKGSTVLDMARAVHKDFSRKFKFARIWGKHKYQGQKVKRDYVLDDEDVIELHI